MISIITASYNSGVSIKNTIESVIEQTYNNWELIIIDDGSTDDTAELVNCYNSFSNIKYFYQKNKGVCSARNYGSSLALGDFLLFLDADDYLYPDTIKNFSNVIYNSKNLGICSGEYIYAPDIIVKPRNKSPYYNNYILNTLVGSYIVNKQVFLNVGGYDIKLTFSENWELFLRLTAYCRENFLEVKAASFKTFKYNHDGSTVKNKIRNLKKINSYKHLYDKYNTAKIRDSELTFKFSEIVAYQYFLANNWIESLNWQIKSIKIKPWGLNVYLKLFRYFFKINISRI